MVFVTNKALQCLDKLGQESSSFSSPESKRKKKLPKTPVGGHVKPATALKYLL